VHIHHSILFADGERTIAEALLYQEGLTYAQDVVVDQVVVNLYAGKAKYGGLLCPIGSLTCRELKSAYRKPWNIDVLYAIRIGHLLALTASTGNDKCRVFDPDIHRLES
jgi:hypothetical protein